MIISYDTVYDAYRKARRGKSRNPIIAEWIKHEEENLKQLHHELVIDNYRIALPTRYIIRDPVVREIIALPFRDRIVQHIIHAALYPLVEKHAIHDVYSNMLDRGTLYGIKRVHRFMRACSDNFTHDAYILKLDIQSFFLSITKDILYQQIVTLVSKSVWSSDTDRVAMMKLIHQSIFFDYRHYHDATHPAQGSFMPYHKTMRSTDGNRGLPLGNLTSQLFANIFMHPFDQFVKHTLQITYYGRYVDDFVLVHRDKEYLLECHRRIRDFLAENLSLTLHPHKYYLQHVRRGVKFLGVMICPSQRVVAQRTISKCYAIIHGNKLPEKKYQSLMSYHGLAIHHNCYRLRKEWMASYINSLE